MRWPWRRERDPGPAGAGPAPVPVPVVRGEWRALPPIQRVVARHPLLNPVQRFTGSLASWRDPSYLAPLGHLVGPAEPAGVADVARPVPADPAGDPPVATPPGTRRRGPRASVWSTVVQRGTDAPPARSVPPEPTVSAAAGWHGVESNGGGPGPVRIEPPGPDSPGPDSPGPDSPGPALPVVGSRPVQRQVADEPVPAGGDLPELPGDAPFPARDGVPAARPGPASNPPAGLAVPAGARAPDFGHTSAGSPLPVAVQRFPAASPTVPVRAVTPSGAFTTAPPVPLPPLVVPAVAGPVPVAPEPQPLAVEHDDWRSTLGADPPPAEPLGSPLAQPAPVDRATPADHAPADQAGPANASPADRAGAAGPVQRSGPVPGAEHQAVQRSVSPPPSSPAARDAAAGRPVERPVVQRTVGQRPAVQHPAVQHPAVQRPAVQRPVVQHPAVQRTVGQPAVGDPPQARRLGLGPPIDPVTLASSVLPDLPAESAEPPVTGESEPTAGTPPAATSTTAPRMATMPTIATPTIAAPTAAMPTAAMPTAAPVLALQRQGAGRPAGPVPPHEPAAATVPLAAAPPVPPLVVARLVGERPIAAPLATNGTEEATAPVPAAATANGVPNRTDTERLSPFVQRQALPAVPAAAPLTMLASPAPGPAVRDASAAVPSPVPVVQRVESAAEPDASTRPAAAAAEPAGAAGPVPAARPAPPGGEPEELLARLYDPLLRRLKADLRLDRERRGVLTDQMH